MAVFFMMVGLEIKRELLTGQLATWGQRALPGFAALGGWPCLRPFTYGLMRAAMSLAGWAIPAATDIAFALGVLALLGSRVPASLKIFLSALAILDDMGAVAIIALFYTSNISFLMLAGAAVTVALLFIMNRAGLPGCFPICWRGRAVVFHASVRVHATIAGILLALFIPLRVTDPDKQSPLARLEHGINPWVTFLILPLFGFAMRGSRSPV
jgi:NhaA family Na+:H+ antiporter